MTFHQFKDPKQAKKEAQLLKETRIKEELKILKELLKENGGEDPVKQGKYLADNAVCIHSEVLGEFFGDPKNESALKAYAANLNFKGKSLVDALRVYLSGFKMPGEAQKISRIMDALASSYHAQNKQQLTETQALLLAFSIIMLNTDLHNDQIMKENKMHKSEFIKNIRGTKEFDNVSDEFLKAIYNDIKHNEIITDVPDTIEKGNINQENYINMLNNLSGTARDVVGKIQPEKKEAVFKMINNIHQSGISDSPEKSKEVQKKLGDVLNILRDCWAKIESTPASTGQTPAQTGQYKVLLKVLLEDVSSMINFERAKFKTQHPENEGQREAPKSKV